MPIRDERRGDAIWIIMDREERANAIDYEHAVAMGRGVEGASSSDARAVVITGAGAKYFSSGIDLSAVAAVSSFEDARRLAYEGIGSMIRSIMDCRKPIVARVNGHALGLGFELVNLADVAFAVRAARVGEPGARWGMIPPISSTLGSSAASRTLSKMVLGAEVMGAEEAYACRLLDGLAEDIDGLDALVDGFLDEVEGTDAWASARSKELLARRRDRGLVEEGLRAFAESVARADVRRRAGEFLEGKEGKGDR